MTFKTLRTFETAFKRPTWKRRRRRGVLMGPYGQALTQWYVQPFKNKNVRSNPQKCLKALCLCAGGRLLYASYRR